MFPILQTVILTLSYLHLQFHSSGCNVVAEHLGLCRKHISINGFVCWDLQGWINDTNVNFIRGAICKISQYSNCSENALTLLITWEEVAVCLE